MNETFNERYKYKFHNVVAFFRLNNTWSKYISITPTQLISILTT